MTRQQAAAVKRAALAIYLNRSIPLDQGLAMVNRIIAKITQK